MYAKVINKQVIDVQNKTEHMFGVLNSHIMSEEELNTIGVYSITVDEQVINTELFNIESSYNFVDGKVLEIKTAIPKDSKIVRDYKLKKGFMWNNMIINCSGESIARLSIHQHRSFETINLKLSGVFYTATYAEYMELLELMAEFIQSCYNEEMI